MIRVSLITYVIEVFPDRVEAADNHRIVEFTLTTFMAPLHAGTHVTGCSPDPDDLVRAIEDAVLDHAEQRVDTARSGGRTDLDDAALLRQAFGGAVTPDLYRSVLADLAAEGLALEFQIVSAYLEELEQPSRHPPVLAPEPVVNQVLLDFRNRVAAKSGPG